MVKIRVPATSANVSVGFDCLGIALDLYTYFTFEEIEGFRIEGSEERFCNEDNLVYTSFMKTLSILNKQVAGVAITIDSHVPVSRGLGSSASCVVGGVVGAFVLTNTTLDKAFILDICTSIEGHPDNVAPAIYGGLCASCVIDEKVLNVAYEIDERFQFLAMIPNFETKTADARKVLPTSISFSDAVQNASRLSVILKAFEQYDLDILHYAMHDILHEPYRKELIHEYEEVKRICQKTDNVSLYISGSGSTLMNIMRSEKDHLEIDKQLASLNYIWETKLLHVDFEGVSIC